MLISPRSSLPEKEYLFIDGGCLRAAVCKICEDIFGSEDAYSPLVSYFTGSNFQKIFYYDAVSGKNYQEAETAYQARVQPEYDRIEKIQAIDRVHVALGQIVGVNRRQKGVDVRLAVDLMTHAFRGNITAATLFAGDADFVPLVEALVAEGLHVTLWHPLQASDRLKRAADSTRLFSFAGDLRCFTSDDVNPAFFLNAAPPASSPPPDAHVVTLHDGRKIAGRWRGDCLIIWLHAREIQWNAYSLAVPGGNLEIALKAFEGLVGLKIAESGPQWIQS